MEWAILMRGSYSVALVGFSQQETSTLESFLRLAARRPPGYQVQDEVMDAQILIVNADNPQALHLVRHAKLPGRVMLIGNTDGGTGWPLQRKPVKLVAVLVELDRLVDLAPTPGAGKTGPIEGHPLFSPPALSTPSAQARHPSPKPKPDPATATAPPPLVAPAHSERHRARHSAFEPTRPMQRADPPTPAPVPMPRRLVAPAPAQRPGVMRMTDFGGVDDLPLPPTRAAPSRRSSDSLLSSGGYLASEMPDLPGAQVLLVAESLVEGRALLRRFKKYGLSVDWSRESAQALVMLKAQAYRLVVIDRLSGQPDAFQVCRGAKQDKHGARAPVVFMLAAIAGSMDRMKAGLAGCDAYLPRSVGEAELYKLLAQHRLVNLDAFAKTNIGI